MQSDDSVPGRESVESAEPPPPLLPQQGCTTQVAHATTVTLGLIVDSHQFKALERQRKLARRNVAIEEAVDLWCEFLEPWLRAQHEENEASTFKFGIGAFRLDMVEFFAEDQDRSITEQQERELRWNLLSQSQEDKWERSRREERLTTSRGTQMKLDPVATASTQTREVPNGEASTNVVQDAVVLRPPSARELELESLLKGSQTVFKQDFERKLKAVEESYEQRGQQKDTLITQLQRTLAHREKVVAKQATTIAANDQVLVERSRELRRSAMEGEADLKSELARVRLLKEKERFHKERMEAALRNAESAADLVETRAYEAEERWADQDRRALFAHEDRERRELEDLYVTGRGILLDGFHSSVVSFIHLERQHARGMRAFMAEVRQLADEEAGDSASESENEGEVQTPTGTQEDILVEVKEKKPHRNLRKPHRTRKERNLLTLERCFAKVKSRSEAEVERQQLTERQHEEGLAQFRSTLAQVTGAMALAEEEWKSKWVEMENKLRASEHKLAVLKEFYSRSRRRSSRSSRAEAMVLDSLIEQHGAELEAMRTTIAELEEDLRHHRKVNRAAEAEEWKAKAEKAAHDLLIAKQEAKDLNIQISILAAEMKSQEGLIQSLSGKLKVSEQNIKDLHEDAAALKAKLQAKIDRLEAEACDVKEDGESLDRTIEEQATQIEDLTAKVRRLRDQNESLCQKWIEFGTEPPAGFGQQSRPTSANNQQDTQEAVEPSPDAPPQFERMQQAPTKEVQSLHDKVERLEQAVLVVKMERDTLKRQLDSAAAEVSASEERRSKTLKKYLNLLSANDAAPRKEQDMLAQQFVFSQKEAQLDRQRAALERKSFEVEKKEAHITRTIATYQARGINLMGASASLKGNSSFVGADGLALGSGSRRTNVPSAHSEKKTPRENLAPLETGPSLSEGRSDSTAMPKQLLRPIMNRPFTQPAPTTSSRGGALHPQKAPIPTAYPQHRQRVQGKIKNEEKYVSV